MPHQPDCQNFWHAKQAIAEAPVLHASRQQPALLAASGSDFCFRSARNTRNTAEIWQAKKTAHERSVTALAQTASPTAPQRDPVPKRQQGDFANSAWTLGIATCPSINLTCLTNSPCSRRIARAPCCSLAVPAARKNNNLLTVSGLFFWRSRLGLEQFLAGRTGGKLSCPLSL